MSDKYYDIDHSIIEDKSRMQNLVLSGQPSHIMVARLSHDKANGSPDPISDAQDAIITLHDQLQQRTGPAPILWTHWPHTDERPRIDAWLRIPPQDTPPLKTLLSLPTPFQVEAKSLDGMQRTISNAYAHVLSQSGPELADISTITSPAWHSIDWRI